MIIIYSDDGDRHSGYYTGYKDAPRKRQIEKERYRNREHGKESKLFYEIFDECGGKRMVLMKQRVRTVCKKE